MWGPILWISNILIWFSFFGNICSIIIFMRSKFRQNLCSILLTALSAMHLGFLVVASPVYIYLTIVSVFPSAQTNNIYHFLLYSHPTAAMFQYAASWLIVIITIEKYMEICHPFTYERYCTRQIIIGIVICNSLTGIAYNLIRFWEYDHDEQGNIRVLLRKDDLYVIYRDIISVLVQTIIPFIVIIVLNILIARRVSELDHNARHLNDHEKQTQEIARCVRYIGIAFVVLYSYPATLNIIELFNKMFWRQSLANFLLDMYSLITIVNTLTVYVFFLAYSQSFRDEKRKVLQTMCSVKLGQTITLPSVNAFKRPAAEGQATGVVSFDPQEIGRETTAEAKI